MSEARTNPNQPPQDDDPIRRNEPVDGAIQLPTRSIGEKILPTSVMPKAEVPQAAARLVETIRTVTDSLVGLVLLKQAEQIVKEAASQMLDHALIKMEGKEADVLGATVKTRRLTEYEYSGDDELVAWEAQIEELKTKISARRKALQNADVINGNGQPVEKAKLIRDGLTLVVSFK